MNLRARLWGAFPTFLIARRNLSRARTRSTLAIAAIVIGVVAIGGIGAGGVAFQDAQLDALGGIGTDLQVFPGEDNREGALTGADVATIDRVTGTTEIVPLRQESARVVERGEVGGSTTVYGVNDPGSLYAVDEGAIPGNWRNGALVGRSFADDHDLGPGSKLTLERTVVRDGESATVRESYRVAAVLEDEGQTAVAAPNDAVVLPPEQFEGDTYSQVIVRAENAAEANATAEDVRDAFNGRREIVQVLDRGRIAEQIDRALNQINLFLVGIGAISLVVAGVSIANVMLMSAIERREEIGVLRAVGYEKGDILRIMLAEAALLGVVGSLLGAAVALGAVALINDALLGDPFAFSVEGLRYVAAGVAFGVLASVLGGLYPAWKAARERPVDALRG